MAEAQPEKVLIRMGEKRSLEHGGLRFVASRREVGEVGGTTLEVWGDVGGENTQVLRFDCFRGAPHYHMPPSAPGQLTLDPAEVGDGLEWALENVRRNLPEMVEKAGFPELAASLDAVSLAAGAPRLRKLMDGLPEPTETLEVDAALIAE